jgi:hypothetical protein
MDMHRGDNVGEFDSNAMHESTDSLRLEIAAVAARLIADSGLDYGAAKLKAARQLTGGASLPRGAMPDGDEIDEALREHLELFDPDHVARLERRRRAAAELMTRLAEFSPYLTGAVWKGICADHAPVHLQLFHDNPKDVEIWLLNEGVQFDVHDLPHFRRPQDGVEALALQWRGEPVLLSLYQPDDLRGALKRSATGAAERGDLAALRRLMEEPGQ